MKENEDTFDPYSILMKEQPAKLDSNLPDYVIDYLEKEQSNQLNRISNDNLRKALEWINDPMNSKRYRNYMLFKSTSSKVLDRDEDYATNGMEIEVPLFKFEF